MGDSGAQGLHLPVSQPTMDRDVTFTEKEADISGFFTSYCSNPESTVGKEGIVPSYFRSSEEFRHLAPMKISEA